MMDGEASTRYGVCVCVVWCGVVGGGEEERILPVSADRRNVNDRKNAYRGSTLLIPKFIDL